MGVKDLTPWPKGTSGNPAGRPKGIPNSKTIFERFLRLKPEDGEVVEGVQLNNYELMILKIIKKAAKGDLKAINDVLDRLEGKPNQSIDVNEKKDPIQEKLSQLTSEQLDKLIDNLD